MFLQSESETHEILRIVEGEQEPLVDLGSQCTYQNLSQEMQLDQATLIHQSDSTRVYHKLDRLSNQPKVYLFALLKMKQEMLVKQNYIKTWIYLKLLEIEMGFFFYDASQSGYEFSFQL